MLRMAHGLFLCSSLMIYEAHGSHGSHGSAYASHGSRIKKYSFNSFNYFPSVSGPTANLVFKKSRVKDPCDP